MSDGQFGSNLMLVGTGRFELELVCGREERSDGSPQAKS
jgi:hypothetical protein